MKKAKRILAMTGVILLLAMYLITLYLGLTANPATKGMLMASLVCTIFIPVLLYAMILTARFLEDRAKDLK